MALSMASSVQLKLMFVPFPPELISGQANFLRELLHHLLLDYTHLSLEFIHRGQRLLLQLPLGLTEFGYHHVKLFLHLK